MTSQPRLPGLDPPRQLRPDTGRQEPALWIRRLCIVRELREGAEQVIRTVELRRGLNILWAPPKEPSDGNALFRSGVAGHTAGKTTFCRLVRYALGERGFATDTTRKRVRDKFPSGWVVAEVVVGGELWTVARPFGIGPHPFCVRGGAIENAFEGGDRLDYQAFVDALETTAVAGLPARRFPTTDEPIRWDHLLPWLTRDQECRFADVLEWRHSASGSDAPSLSTDERQFLMRSVLGLISDEEREEQQKNARLVVERKEATQREPLLSHQASVDHGRVQSLLGAELAPPSSGLFGSQARTELDRRRSDVNNRIAALDASDQRAGLRTALEHAVQTETNARRDLQEADARLAAERMALEQLVGRAKGEQQVALLGSLPPARDYCNVPMTLARERACPLAISRPIDLAERRSERSAAEELGHLQEVVRALEARIEEKRGMLTAAEASTKAARRAFLEAATSFDEQRARLLEERAELGQAERLVRDTENAWKRSTEQSDAVKRLTSEIEESYKRQEEWRRERREALGRFSATFDYVARALLGDEVEGRVDTSGRGLSLIVEHHGERDSAALASVKLLAFDLASVTDSVEGRGYFPRFLIHDGPREADMAPDIYERLFLYAGRLEECFGAEPSFQYIVTTTAPPPKSLQTSPWLMQPLLDASIAEGRLLGVDL